VIDLLPIKYRHRRLYPVGRLDKDSSGLVLLTNDGDLTYRITHPRFEYEKEYEVLVKGELKAGEIRRMEMGIKLEENKTSPAVVKKIKSNDYNYGITIREGRKHQVKRMFEAIGHPVLELRRVRMGNLKLGKLKKGGVREVGKIEL
jgi:23S rRNA pseudouridine2605 synthase